MNYTKLNNLLGWLSFVFGAIVYVSTVEPTASFWDCGEYIATSYKLEVGHPPGAPLFLMIGRVFSMFASTESVALMVNLISALSSALTITFLFWTITALARKMVLSGSSDTEISTPQMVAIFGSGLIGGMAYTFSDTFWFSAVEGEVYAMSSLFTAIVFWAILKWEQKADEPGANRWLVLIAYLIGLSIGIHLLNLLAIPALAFVIYFKKYKTTTKGFLITGVLGVVILGLVQNFIIPQVVNVASKFELFFVNTVELPVNSGSYIFSFLLLSGIVWAIYYTQKNNKPLFNTIVVAFAVLLIGYSSFVMILVRSSANPPIDENNPENMINLLAYLNRDQYGEWPLLYGQYFNSPLESNDLDGDGRVDAYVDGNPVYYVDKEKGRYVISDDRKASIPNYASEFKAVFPRMWSSKKNHIRAYKQWSDFKGKKIRYRTISGKTEVIAKPTFTENMRFFFRYQINWMYWRYFMWNFSGRQNDIQGHGNFMDGNWLSGVNFIDKERLGPQDTLTDDMLDNKARNTFYMLPLILGLIGLIYHLIKDPKSTFVVFLLFMFTGLAIVLYLNQYPYQPRERDYAYAGSFYAYAIWIGLGVFALYRAAKEMNWNAFGIAAGIGFGLGILVFLAESAGGGDHSFSYSLFYMTFIGLIATGAMKLVGDAIQNKMAYASLAIALCLSVPVVMGADGWDDHDRSGRYTARDIARNYLDSCKPNAILFTNGDNDTFPLWYIQEVEGFRTDVRVVNLTLLSTDWFIDQMKRQAYDGDAIPGILTQDDYRQGVRDYVPVVDQNKSGVYADVKKLMQFVTDNSKKRKFGGDRNMNYLPTTKFSLQVDSAQMIRDSIVAPELADRIVPALQWEVKKNYIMKSELVLMDILAHNNWERPIYFANTMPKNSYFGLGEYMQHEGFAYRLVPIKTPDPRNNYGYMGRVETEIMYKNMMEKFKWGGLENPDIYLEENNQRFVTNLRLNFTRLAQTLYEQGDKERAGIVLDKCMEVAANANTTIDVTLLSAAEIYYRLGNFDAGNNLTRRLAHKYEQDLYFYNSLDQERFRQVKKDLEQAVAIMNQLEAYAKQFKQTELEQELTEKNNAIRTIFSTSPQLR